MFKKPIQLIKGKYGTIWEKDEQILLFVRRHWFALWPAYLAVFLMVAIIIIFIFLFYFLGFNQFLSSLDLVVSPGRIFWLIVFMLFLSLILFLYLSWMEYYLDITIVTNRRVIDIEQLNLFRRKIVATELISIQDVRSEVRGFFQSTLDFGTVLIQTAGESPNFTLRDLPNPSNVVRRISAAAAEDFNPSQESKQIKHNEEDLKKHENEFVEELAENKNNNPDEKIVPKTNKKNLRQNQDHKKQQQAAKSTNHKHKGEINF